MNFFTRLRTSLRNEKGAIDLQSIMVGIIVAAIVASTALVSIIGVTRLVAVDAGRTTLRVLSTGLESFYTQYDRYPLSMEELTAEEFVPRNYATMDGLCYQVYRTSDDLSSTGLTATDYPQHYEAAAYIDATQEIYFITSKNVSPTKETTTNTHCL